jgi:hypothetical protein
MSDQLHHTTRRRMRYLQEIGIAPQIAAIVDELRVIRARSGNVYEGSPAFDDLCARIDAIKAEEPRP